MSYRQTRASRRRTLSRQWGIRGNSRRQIEQRSRRDLSPTEWCLAGLLLLGTKHAVYRSGQARPANNNDKCPVHHSDEPMPRPDVAGFHANLLNERSSKPCLTSSETIHAI